MHNCAIKKLCFFMGIKNDWLDAVDTIQQIRLIYPDSDIITIADGTNNQEYENKIAPKFNVRHFACDDLRSSGRSPGAWIERWMKLCVDFSYSDYFIKIDPDTDIISRLSFLPDADISGCSYGNGFKSFDIQGGCEIVSRKALFKILASGFLSDPLYWSNKFSSERMTKKYSTSMQCESAVFSHIIKRCRLSYFEHPEIYCATRIDKNFNSLPYSVIHPKNWKLKVKAPLLPRVFGVGLPKTGTSSLHEAFLQLGYNSVHYPWDMGKIACHNAATDITVAICYKELAERFPDAKFILTVRDMNSWLESIEAHLERVPYEKLNNTDRETRKKWLCAVFGIIWDGKSKCFDKVLFKNGFENWTKKITDFFKDNLLILDICAGDGWEKLCTFLDRPVPDLPFPHANARIK